MHPRTIFISVGVLLLLGFVGRWAVQHYALLPFDEESVLRQAVAITVTYPTGANTTKSVRITKLEDVAEALAALRLRGDRDYGRNGGMARAGVFVMTNVTFHFPDGSVHGMGFENPRELGQQQVEPDFARRLATIASRLEGRPVDLFPNIHLDPFNGQRPNPGFDPDGPPGGMPGGPPINPDGKQGPPDGRPINPNDNGPPPGP